MSVLDIFIHFVLYKKSDKINNVNFQVLYKFFRRITSVRIIIIERGTMKMIIQGQKVYFLKIFFF